MSSKSASQKKILYAVVGFGQLAQVAVIPAFVHAENSELVGLVAGDPIKRRNSVRSMESIMSSPCQQYAGELKEKQTVARNEPLDANVSGVTLCVV